MVSGDVAGIILVLVFLFLTIYLRRNVLVDRQNHHQRSKRT